MEKYKKRIIIILLLIGIVSLMVYRLKLETDKDMVPILMYHNVVKKNDINKITYSITDKKFEKHMKTLKNRGYTPISISELEDYIYKGKELPKKPVMITLDDGKYNNFVNAYPILKKYDLKYNMFLIGKNSNKETKINYDYSNEYKYYCQKKEIKSMRDSNLVEYGSHTYDLHFKENKIAALINRDLYSSNIEFVEKISEDLIKSKGTIEKATDYSCNSLAYPYGSYDDEVMDVASKMGMRLAFSTDIGVFKKGDNPYKIKRINIDGLCSKYRLIAQIELAKILTLFRNN